MPGYLQRLVERANSGEMPPEPAVRTRIGDAAVSSTEDPFEAVTPAEKPADGEGMHLASQEADAQSPGEVGEGRVRAYADQEVPDPTPERPQRGMEDAARTEQPNTNVFPQPDDEARSDVQHAPPGAMPAGPERTRREDSGSDAPRAEPPGSQSDRVTAREEPLPTREFVEPTAHPASERVAERRGEGARRSEGPADAERQTDGFQGQHVEEPVFRPRQTEPTDMQARGVEPATISPDAGSEEKQYDPRPRRDLPGLVIDSITVEVAEPAPGRAQGEAREAPRRRRPKRPSRLASRPGPSARSNLRFGLGQI